MKKIGTILLTALLLAALSGCGASGGSSGVTVQSVAMLTGLDAAGQVNRYAGVVSAGKQTDVKKDDAKTVERVWVSVGDDVTKGQTLFTYDTASTQMDLDKAKLQYQQMQVDIQGQSDQKAQLEKEKAAAPAEGQLSYTLEIQTLETAIREAQYNLTLQQKEIEKLQGAVGNNAVTSPVDGRVLAVNTDGGTDSSGSVKPMVSLVEAGGYQVKGTIDETNRTALTEGAAVLIRSRVDDTAVWKGSVSRIDWENPISTGSSGGLMTEKYAASSSSAGGSETAAGASKYPFYVKLEAGEGLLLGQHVFVEPDVGQGQSGELRLPGDYFTDAAGSSPWVWAATAQNKLEKRPVKLSDHQADTDTWRVDSGLTAQDYIAYPDDTLKEGMAVSRLDASAFSGGEDAGITVADKGLGSTGAAE